MRQNKLATTLASASAVLLIIAGLASTTSITAQQQQGQRPPAASSAAAPIPPAASVQARIKATITATSTPLELARAAFEAHGGEKFRQMQNIVLMGSVDVYSTSLPTTLSGKFAMITAGERYRLEVQVPSAPLIRQIFDGQQAYSSIPGASIPPPSKFSLYVLNNYDRTGYVVSALPDKKKQRAFRITDPEGNINDFFIDPATGRVEGLLYKYRNITFGTEHKNFKEIDGVLIPASFSQKLEISGNAYYVEFKAKDIKVNQPIDADVFAIPTQ